MCLMGAMGGGGGMLAMMHMSITKTVQELIPGNWDMLSLRSSSAWTLLNCTLYMVAPGGRGTPIKVTERLVGKLKSNP